jgi:hypothetical protein
MDSRVGKNSSPNNFGINFFPRDYGGINEGIKRK